MKRMKFTGIVGAASATLLAVAPATLAQTPNEMLKKAETSCIQKAEADGYQLNRVVTAEETANGGAKVVLDLTKVSDGTKAPLTCNLTKDGTVSFGDAVATAADAVRAPGIAPWLWALLPLIGLPLLLAWARGRRTEEAVAATRRYVPAGASERIYERHEATIRSNSDTLDVYSGPGTAYRVTGSVRNGQRITLTGRYDNNWAELENGGWIPAEYITAATRLVR